MSRKVVVVWILLLAAPFARAQGQVSESDTPSLDRLEPLEPVPTRAFAFERTLQRSLPGSGEVSHWTIHPVSDSLTEAQIVRRIARIYDYQARLLQAEVAGDERQVDELLQLAMTNLTTLLQHDGLLERPRFQELYRSVLTEYERYYGPVDTLDIERGDIYQLRADLFAALEADRAPMLEDVTLASIRPAETVIPMTMHRLVKQSISYLLKSPDKHMYHWLSRADTYFPMIEKVLADVGAPDEIKYLAMIESGLNPQAKSWARAVGMWQFMTFTGRAYGLEVNTWVDERRDPEKATRAAGRHLIDLEREFGDWHLAIAAYNCGAGNVRKAQRRARARGLGQDFFSIYPYLPRETRNYVPMYIAASLVASNPTAFGLDLDRVKDAPEYEYEYVPVQGMLSVRTVARLAGVDASTIRALNPELKRDYLPPSDRPYYVRLPMGTYPRFAEGYASLPAEERARISEHTVRRGETLGGIARRYGVSVSDLRQSNDIRGSLIRVGQQLMVPVPTYEGGTAIPVNIADAQPITVTYGTRAIRPIAVNAPAPVPVTKSSPPVVKASLTSNTPEPKPEPEAKEEKQTRVVYSVRRGDSLGKIASKHKVRVSELKAWNELRSNTIRPGQRLTIYLDGTGPAPEPAATVTYTVRRGDTLSEIADRYKVSVSSLRASNNLRGSTIRVGQRLTITPGASGSITHVVRRGDNLHDIAKQYGTTVSNLKSWNNLRTTRLMPGQRLTIQR